MSLDSTRESRLDDDRARLQRRVVRDAHEPVAFLHSRTERDARRPEARTAATATAVVGRLVGSVPIATGPPKGHRRGATTVEVGARPPSATDPGSSGLTGGATDARLASGGLRATATATTAATTLVARGALGATAIAAVAAGVVATATATATADDHPVLETAAALTDVGRTATPTATVDVVLADVAVAAAVEATSAADRVGTVPADAADSDLEGFTRRYCDRGNGRTTETTLAFGGADVAARSRRHRPRPVLPPGGDPDLPPHRSR